MECLNNDALADKYGIKNTDIKDFIYEENWDFIYFESVDGFNLRRIFSSDNRATSIWTTLEKEYESNFKKNEKISYIGGAIIVIISIFYFVLVDIYLPSQIPIELKFFIDLIPPVIGVLIFTAKCSHKFLCEASPILSSETIEYLNSLLKEIYAIDYKKKHYVHDQRDDTLIYINSDTKILSEIKLPESVYQTGSKYNLIDVYRTYKLFYDEVKMRNNELHFSDLKLKIKFVGMPYMDETGQLYENKEFYESKKSKNLVWIKIIIASLLAALLSKIFPLS